MRSALFILILAAGLWGCSSKHDSSRIYYFGRQAPGVNLFSVDLQKNVQRHTIHSGARDIDLSVSANGDLFFTSNRVLPEDREARAKQGRMGDRRQDLNIFHLPAGQLETDRFLATPLAKTQSPESQIAITRDGQRISFVRTLLPEKNRTQTDAKRGSEELYVMEGVQGEPQRIHSADIILKPQWSPDGTKLVFATYNYQDKQAQLLIYDGSSRSVVVVLENPWESFQIDAPQWSPDGKYLSIIAHPLGIEANRGLYVLNFGSETLVKVSPDNASVQTPVSWGKSNDQILYGALVDYSRNWSDELRTAVYQGSSQIFISDLTGKTQQLTQGENQVHANPTFSPDNKLVAYVYTDSFQNRKASLRIMDIKGNLVDTLAEDLARNGYLIWQ